MSNELHPLVKEQHGISDEVPDAELACKLRCKLNAMNAFASELRRRGYDVNFYVWSPKGPGVAASKVLPDGAVTVEVQKNVAI